MNRATLAVAGSRKTQSIIDDCASVDGDVTKRLALTYTLTSQHDLERRLRAACLPSGAPEVAGWYAFLLRYWVRPFLPLKYQGRRLQGLNFDGEPPRGKFATGESRYLDDDSRAYKLHLSKLAIDVCEASAGGVIDRLERIFDEIYIDEAQDLTGYDLGLIRK